LLQNLVGLYTERWLTILGLVYVLTVLFAPRGIYDAVRRRLPLARLRRPARDVSPQWSK
jgi:ABC-type branched-subunit amino acid transport system permease subunit